MRRIISLLLLTTVLLSLALTLIACDNTANVVGSYEMTDFRGRVKYCGNTTELENDLFDYYRIDLGKDRTYKLESRRTGTASSESETGTWNYREGIITLTSGTDGSQRQMSWDYIYIVYEAEEQAVDMTVSYTLTLRHTQR